MANSDIYNDDGKCYSILNTVSDQSFNTYFNKYKFTSTYDDIVRDCETKANEERKDFFLIGDAEQLGNDFRYTCYIPKIESGCENNKLETLFKPFTELIDTIFGKKDATGNRGGVNIDVNHVVSASNFINVNPSNEEDCFKVTNAEGNTYSFGKNKKYTLYQSSILNSPETLTSLATMNDVNYYNNVKNNVFNYDSTLNNLHTKIKDYIKGTPDSREILENNLDRSIEAVIQKYNDMMSSKTNIEGELDLVNQVTGEYTSYFKTVQESINDKKDRLHELIGLDGANNGKYEDSKKMKNLLLSEIIILSLIIVFSIYFYSKKK